MLQTKPYCRGISHSSSLSRSMPSRPISRPFAQSSSSGIFWEHHREADCRMRGLPATLASESNVPLGRTPAAVIAGTTVFRIARRAIFTIFLVILSNWRQHLVNSTSNGRLRGSPRPPDPINRKISPLHLLEVVCFGKLPQLRARRFWRYIPLRHSQHLITHHKFSYRGGTQQRRIKVRVKVEFRIGSLVRRALMKSHSVGKRRTEQVVVTNGKPSQDVRQARALFTAQFRQARHASPTDEQRFERPDGPKWDQCDEVLVLADNSLVLRELQAQVVLQEKGFLSLVVLFL